MPEHGATQLRCCSVLRNRSQAYARWGTTGGATTRVTRSSPRKARTAKRLASGWFLMNEVLTQCTLRGVGFAGSVTVSRALDQPGCVRVALEFNGQQAVIVAPLAPLPVPPAGAAQPEVEPAEEPELPAPPAQPAAAPAAAPAQAPQEQEEAARPAGTRSWAWREARATRAGEEARAKLSGMRAVVEPTPELPANLRNRVYVVLQSAPGREALTGVASTWARARDLVGTPPSDLAVFHGFPSIREAEAYWAGAGRRGRPPQL
jgi:hypothetical protein